MIIFIENHSRAILHENKDIKITKPESETDVPFLEFLLNIFSNKTNDSNISKFNISGENSRINSNKNSLNNSSNNHSNSDNSKFIVDIIGFGCWFWYRL
ncbi:hypothetical protein HYD82_03705 [Mycoplasmopsis bovis]|nr:hypothetical protein [Mycoplasmopsis bovis]QQH34502.1 hypothetical protein HYD97_03595 [Mycoplasmopsis bovis]QQH36714.1 hypothetical protein HYD87_03750 [Mycoplasmopsis bovis]QQH37400.1 hypothetical protein HYD83_03505 [Mycoplasmopsis bovis]QQH37653.1 hypothetical protein HYD82_03705 [Mycoplasmopsis bovis]